MSGALDSALRSGDLTLPRLLLHWARTTPDALAFREKDLGIWNRMTWRHYHDTARRFALGLLALGFRPGERLAIASEDTPEWMFADLGTQAIGGVVVGIYPTNPWPELQYIVHHSNSRFVVCGDQEHSNSATSTPPPRPSRHALSTRASPPRSPTTPACWSTPRAPPVRPRARCCRTATC